MQASFEDDWRQKLQHLQSENLLAKIIEDVYLKCVLKSC